MRARARVCVCVFVNVTCRTRVHCIYILLISDHPIHRGYIRIFLKSSFWIHSPREKFWYYVHTVCGETQL